jgi:RNA-directed DNA polymerase
MTPVFEQLTSFASLYSAFTKAAKGKRAKPSVATFEFALESELLELEHQLRGNTYQPQAPTQFVIREPKQRLISAAAFRDRVVHHAICSVLEPRFEQVFLPSSYANRRGFGNHRALTQVKTWAKKHKYFLRLDVRKHFENIDHATLMQILQAKVSEPDLLQLIQRILDSHPATDRANSHYFTNDDLLSALRPKGLPIGNLTSQFWSNCYLNGIDHYVGRTLQCKAYARYVDDLVLFSNNSKELEQWKQLLTHRFESLRLRLHANGAYPNVCAAGIPWLGFIVYRNKTRIKARKVIEANRRLCRCYIEAAIDHSKIDLWHASLRGWINHARYGDTWKLRLKMLSGFKYFPPLKLKPQAHFSKSQAQFVYP